MKMINCTRWSESVASMQFHADLANALNAPTEFRLLNQRHGFMVGGGPSSREGYNKLMKVHLSNFTISYEFHPPYSV